MKRFAVVFEYNLKDGICYLARKDRGEGEVALFKSREEARSWLNEGKDVELNIWDINIFEFTV